jgi:hypothetical protein
MVTNVNRVFKEFHSLKTIPIRNAESVPPSPNTISTKDRQGISGNIKGKGWGPYEGGTEVPGQRHRVNRYLFTLPSSLSFPHSLYHFMIPSLVGLSREE